MAPRRLAVGAPEPLGVTPMDGGVNVAVWSGSAEAVEFCLFDASGAREIERVTLPGRTGDVLHGFVGGVAPGARYGLRAHGPWAPREGHRFNPAKLLVDPWATAIDRPFGLDPSLFDAREGGAPRDDLDSAAHVPKGIVAAAEPPPPLAVPRAAPDWERLVIYELHVRGFTKLHPDVPEPIRGTYAGLAHPAAIAHLARLGVTAVELMPSSAWVDERHLGPLGLSNYWGYNPVAFLAPDPRLAPGGWPEVRHAVDTLRAAGIAVILDVVPNHTGEGDRYGPTLAFRGLDNAGWYRLRPDDRAAYVDDAGCGNVLALDRPQGVRLIMDMLRIWASRGGVDGFRYDLATVMGRRPDGFDPDAPLVSAIRQDPVLAPLVHIAEPWDIGPGGYRVGAFPPAWGEWNDRYRDTARRFWRGDGGLVGAMATRLAGSADLFAARHRPLSRSVNFVTAHDGFTLADLVAYGSKHNEANGEQNRDGTNDNQSWNNGVEGPTEDATIVARRAADVRALLATLLVSRGTPMLSMGDEVGRSQGGNNNAYAQDNAVAWLDWARADTGLADFTARLVALRLAHPALRAEAVLTGRPAEGAALPDVAWLTPSGRAMTEADWNFAENRTLVADFYQPATDADEEDRCLVVLHAGAEAIEVTLPARRIGREWTEALDSAAPDAPPAPVTGSVIAVAARSVVVVTEAASGGRGKGDPALLAALARAAGIADHWWDIDGSRYAVSDDTLRAILAGMRLPAATAGETRDSIEELSARRGRALPPATVVRAGLPATLLLGPDAVALGRPVAVTLTTEAGETRDLLLDPASGVPEPVATPDGRRRIGARVALPDLPVGYHALRFADDPAFISRLIVAPATAWPAPALAGGARRFGVAAHLYGLRRRADQGIGDFTTLARFAREAAAEGAVTVGLNPMHALFGEDRSRASPYHPSDRRFLDPIYIDVQALPEALPTDAVRAALDQADLAFRPLADLAAVDYPAVWAAKASVLDAAFGVFEALPPEHPLVAEFGRYVSRQGAALDRFGAFEAIAASRPGEAWRAWPAELADPASPAVARFSAGHRLAVHASRFRQWLADRQLGQAAEAARRAGLSLGFYRDLAVGCAPDGAEAWSEQRLVMAGLSIGAPPDPFAAGGQVWSLPPPNPLALAEDGYAGFARLIRANMAHAGALRIDHVLGLRRLFMVPEGASGAEGAYVAMPFDDLLGVLALESRRSRTLVVGEDLGTVPEGFRDRMAETGILSYRVLWFERQGDGAFLPPTRYPAQAAACVSTHDLATLAGWWSGEDIAENLRLGRIDAALADALLAGRARERAALVAAIETARLAPGVEPRRPMTSGLVEALEEAGAEDGLDPDGAMTPALAGAIHAFLADAPSSLLLVQADDLAGEREAVNLPGTDRERPNWRRKTSVAVEDLFATAMARRILAALAARRAPPMHQADAATDADDGS
jgi:glycogen operon protein